MTENSPVSFKNGRSSQRRRRLMVKTYRHPRESTIHLHLQNATGFPNHPERRVAWFIRSWQREARGSIDMSLLKETRVTLGKSATMEKDVQLHLEIRGRTGRSLST